MATEGIDLVLRVASSSFTQAIDMGACVSILSISNNEHLSKNLDDGGAARAAGLVQKALFQRLLLWTMVAYDPVRRGDYHLRVGIDQLAEKAIFSALADRGDGKKLQQAIDCFAKADGSEETTRLRHLRNKEAAHSSELDSAITRATIGELLAFADKTSVIVERFAQGAGVVALSLESQIKAHTESAQAFWRPWMPS